MVEATRSTLIRNLKIAEGCRLEAYRDTLGYLTIGYGHLLEDTLANQNLVITPEEAERYLDDDLRHAEEQAASLPETHLLDDVRLQAIQELVFNLGINKWKKFVNTRAAISDGRWQDASNHLKNSLWYTQVGRRRGDRIAYQIRTGTYPPDGGSDPVA